MGAQVRRNEQAYSQLLFGRGGLGERRFSQRSGLSPRISLSVIFLSCMQELHRCCRKKMYEVLDRNKDQWNLRRQSITAKGCWASSLAPPASRPCSADAKGATLAVGTHDWENRLENGLWTYSMEDIIGGLQGCLCLAEKAGEGKVRHYPASPRGRWASAP